jgi:hypothetical protein
MNTIKFCWPDLEALKKIIIILAGSFWFATGPFKIYLTSPQDLTNWEPRLQANVGKIAWQQRHVNTTQEEFLSEYLILIAPQSAPYMGQDNRLWWKSLWGKRNNTYDQISLLLRYSLPSQYQQRISPYLPLIVGLSKKYHVEPLWILAMMWAESHFDAMAHSRARAIGLMQIVPDTAGDIIRWMGLSIPHHQIESYLANPYTNIELGIFYMRYLLDIYDDYKYATVAYNMGHGWVSKRIRQGQMVGNRNIYLTKVLNAYQYLEKNYVRQIALHFGEDNYFQVSFVRH